jgi:flagellar motility protein MotE (MotC chaperone)
MRQKHNLKALIASQDKKSSPPKLHVLFPKKQEQSLELKLTELEERIKVLESREKMYVALLKEFNERLNQVK